MRQFEETKSRAQKLAEEAESMQAVSEQESEQNIQDSLVFPDNVDQDLKRILQARSLYEVLGVDSDASREAIKHAFNRLSKKFHGDRLASVIKEQINTIKEENPNCIRDFDLDNIQKLLNEAKDMLSNDDIRAIYNESIYEIARGAFQQKISTTQGAD